MGNRYHVNDHDSTRYNDWLDKAREDMESAGILSRHENCYNAAAFHCHQAIEKALKAYILLKSDILVDGHNLTWLCKRAMRYDKHFHKYLDESTSLNKCYIETRYPADIPLELSGEAVARYHRMAHDMYSFIQNEVDAILKKGAGHPGQLEKRPPKWGNTISDI